MSFSLHIALSLWFEKSRDSRSNYVRLREIMQLTKSFASQEDFNNIVLKMNILTDEQKTNLIHSLSLKLDSLKRQVRRHVSLLQLMRKAQTINIEKMSLLAARRKKKRQRRSITRIFWQYWYDSMNLVRTILSATKLRAQMHFDMTKYVDEDIELWHFNAWDSSIRATFENVCYIKREKLIIFDDIVRLKHSCVTVNTFDCERVTFIDRDQRSDAAILDEIRLTLQTIVDIDHI